MTAFLKGKKNITAAFLSFAGVAALLIFLNNVYGNPFSKANAEKNIKAYIVDTYGVTDFILTDIEYIADFGEYGTTVAFKDSQDIVFDVSYSVKETRITDNYSSTVANGLNTFLRLSSEYGKRVMEVVLNHYSDETAVCYGELGKNRSLSECGEKLVADMEFDMYNLPLEATISLFVSREDTSPQQFAKELAELQKLMYANEIAVDYYDIMYNSSILLEDFPSSLVVENLENTDALAECVEQFMQ